MPDQVKYPEDDAPFDNPNMSTFFWGVTRASNAISSKPKHIEASCEEIYKGLSEDEAKTFEYLASTNMQ